VRLSCFIKVRLLLNDLLLQVLFAFMVGLHNLYWYYGSQTYKQEGTDKLVHTSEAFQGFVLSVIAQPFLFRPMESMHCFCSIK